MNIKPSAKSRPEKTERVPTASQLRSLLTDKLLQRFSVEPAAASKQELYHALVLVLKDLARSDRVRYIREAHEQETKQIYYLCMEFLMGRSLKNTLFNLRLTQTAEQVLKEYDVKLSELYELEPDAGLGNGGLGRLAACFLDALATAGYPAIGYCLLYEYGIFRQKLVDGWQTEMPDFWLPGGESWLLPRPELSREVRFDGYVREWWEGGRHFVEHQQATVVIAQPFDLMVPGLDGRGVSTLRLWKATAPGMDMSLFNQGEYLRAMEHKAMAEVITQVLYPADNHREGKSLRLSQQYFLSSASLQDILQRHLQQYGRLDNLPDKAAIHINDTHPALSIPELMRLLLDEHGQPWENAWNIVTHTVSYTNHTVMAEALECWPEDLVRARLPRIHQILCEIDRRLRAEWQSRGIDAVAIDRMAIISGGVIRMANLCVAASHTVNGVSRLHGDIIKESVFRDAYALNPQKFMSVTNGIAHRRWLCQANPALSAFIRERIGDGFVRDASQLSRLRPFLHDDGTLEEFATIKRQNKERLAAYIRQHSGILVDPDSLFDVQVKRLHEYKRQHLNALHILHQYLTLKENPDAPFVPRTYLFGAKAAPGYRLAKEIIALLCTLSKVIDEDPAVRDKLKVVYLEDYRVTLAELLIPAADISEQISLAGTEASGTGNMKLMMNGAVTLGTLDGANIEIRDAVGEDNMFLFGMTADEVAVRRAQGYRPHELYTSHPLLRRVIDLLYHELGGRNFSEIAGSLTGQDPYMVLADFDAYRTAQKRSGELYRDRHAFTRMALANTASSGIFAADRTIAEYAGRIWKATAVR